MKTPVFKSKIAQTIWAARSLLVYDIHGYDYPLDKFSCNCVLLVNEDCLAPAVKWYGAWLHSQVNFVGVPSDFISYQSELSLTEMQEVRFMLLCFAAFAAESEFEALGFAGYTAVAVAAIKGELP